MDQWREGQWQSCARGKIEAAQARLAGKPGVSAGGGRHEAAALRGEERREARAISRSGRQAQLERGAALLAEQLRPPIAGGRGTGAAGGQRPAACLCLARGCAARAPARAAKYRCRPG